MKETSLIINKNDPATRPPEEIDLPNDTKNVEIATNASNGQIISVDHLWDTFFDSPSVSLDFMEDRNQPKV
ncbi:MULTISPECIES: AbrB/MazE/SpoVT family DNA-binding domain-containing protein [Thalassospira]|uniref:Antitoxin n=2 Tax=Thalassospira TaxID=168934 RepID=A0A367W6T5_9PROT|nr:MULTISPECIES: AbrB/MazE/SpoVT family DNA-binding domain-containing protein [Thalassospira]MDG4719223.1 AbrB/MazE/SpoVT family DNA-binding domain-containing protein [Thalassospira sp. FZY0004]RCK37145.1 hypothetical protein TH19_11400 [Thalassospira profundimaris]